MRERRIISVLLAVMIVSSTLAACNQKAEVGKGSKKVTELKFMIVAGSDEMPAWNGIVDSFNSHNSDVKVTLEQVPGSWDEYNQKMSALIAAGTPPDIGRLGIALMPQYETKNQLVDLTAYMSELNLNDYYAGAFDSGKSEGKIYGLPIGIYTLVLYYNKALFDAAGVKYPPTDWNKPWSLDEFRKVAKQLTKGSGVNKQYGFYCNLDLERITPFLYGNGGNYFNDTKTEALLNSDAAKSAYKLMQDMIFSDKSSPTPAQAKTMPVDQLFTSNKLAMTIDGQWMMPAYTKDSSFKLGVAAVPAGMVKCETVNFVDQYVIFQGSKNVKEAWRVIKSFIQTDGENVMVDKNVGGIPVLKAVAEGKKSVMFNPLSAEEKDVMFNSIEHSQALPFTSNWAELKDNANKSLDLVGLNQMKAGLALDKINGDWNAMLKK
jgi:multiple sugar transport system substrate-binding protein